MLPWPHPHVIPRRIIWIENKYKKTLKMLETQSCLKWNFQFVSTENQKLSRSLIVRGKELIWHHHHLTLDGKKLQITDLVGRESCDLLAGERGERTSLSHTAGPLVRPERLNFVHRHSHRYRSVLFIYNDYRYNILTYNISIYVISILQLKMVSSEIYQHQMQDNNQLKFWFTFRPIDKDSKWF